MSQVKRFKMKTAMKDEIREVEIRARPVNGGWEAQMYMLPRPRSDPILTHEEKLGTAVRFNVASEQEALNGMLDHVKKYLKLSIIE
jgi:hypothetical protein